MGNAPHSNGTLFPRAVLAAQGLLLPWLGATALMIGLDYVQPLYAEQWAQTIIRFAKLYLMAAFAYAAWTEMAGHTEESLLMRFFSRSLGLFLLYFIMGVAVNIAGSVLAMLLISLGPVLGALGGILLAAVQNALLVYFLASTAGRDFMVGLMGIPALFRRTRLWAAGLVLVNPGLPLFGAYLLSRADVSARIPGAVAIGALQILLTLFLLMGLLRCRVDMDNEIETKQTGQDAETKPES